MKCYEEAARYRLPIRMPVVIRLDGKAFHTFTRHCERPFDENLHNGMMAATKMLFEEVPARVAYKQSDEVSLLLVDYNKFDSKQWFNGIIQKMSSVAASIMGVEFSAAYGKRAYFDCRTFVVPERDIRNYFTWRQKDATRNAILMAAQSHFSPKQMHGKKCDELLEIMPCDFSRYPAWARFGTFATRGGLCESIDLRENKGFLDRFLTVEEE